MGIPSALGTIQNIHYYQGIIIAEVAVTLWLYIIVRIIHYLIWGANEEQEQAQAPSPQKNQSEPEEDRFVRKWDQKKFDLYFPYIYTTHMACLSLMLLYIPYIFQTIMAYIHLAGFIGLIIVNIFLKDEQQGNGKRTWGSRVLWAIMCICNFCQLVAGLVGVTFVL